MQKKDFCRKKFNKNSAFDKQIYKCNSVLMSGNIFHDEKLFNKKFDAVSINLDCLSENKNPLDCFMNKAGEFLWKKSHEIKNLYDMGFECEAMKSKSELKNYFEKLRLNNYFERSIKEKVDFF